MQVSVSLLPLCNFIFAMRKKVLICLVKDTINFSFTKTVDLIVKNITEYFLLFLLELWGKEHSVFRM